MSLSELPDAVYQQEDLKDPTLKGPVTYITYVAIALGVGLAFSTQYFAFLLEFSPRLAGDPSISEGVTRQAYRILGLAGIASGALGVPFGYWYSKQPKTMRYRGIFAICLFLLAVSPLFYVYSFEKTYAFWLFGHWAYLYYPISGLHTPLYWASGGGLIVATLCLAGLIIGTTGQVFEIDGAYGSAHWGDGTWLAEGKPQSFTGQLMSTAEEWGVPIGWRGDRMLFDREGLHTYVQAPTGSGKTVGFVVPTLLLHRGSLMAIDIKRELYYVTARRRSEINDEVHRLDPFAEDIEPARYNPLDLIDTTVPDRGNSTAIERSNSIASTLIVKPQGSSQNEYFLKAAENLIHGLILYVCATKPKPTGDTPNTGRTLGAVRDLLTRPNGHMSNPDEGTLRHLLRQMGEFDGVGSDGEKCARGVTRGIRSKGNQFADTPAEEFGSVVSTARTQTNFLTSSSIRDSLSASSFQFEEMQTRPNGVSVYVALPSNRLEDYFRWLRLIVVSARAELIELTDMERENNHPTLFMLEEAPRLGRMETIDAGLSIDRGEAHIQYMLVAQSYSQLVDSYGEDIANNILSNCRLKMMWGASTQDDAEMISNLCGERTVAFQTTNKSHSRSSGTGTQKTVSESIQEQGRALVTPDEVSRVSENWTFVFTRGEAPLLLQRPNYVEDEALFQDHADPHPDYAPEEEFRKAVRRRRDIGIEEKPSEGGPQEPAEDAGIAHQGDGLPSPSEPPSGDHSSEVRPSGDESAVTVGEPQHSGDGEFMERDPHGQSGQTGGGNGQPGDSEGSGGSDSDGGSGRGGSGSGDPGRGGTPHGDGVPPSGPDPSSGSVEPPSAPGGQRADDATAPLEDNGLGTADSIEEYNEDLQHRRSGSPSGNLESAGSREIEEGEDPSPPEKVFDAICEDTAARDSASFTTSYT